VTPRPPVQGRVIASAVRASARPVGGVYASNFLLYENDPDSAELNVGTAQEPALRPPSLADSRATP
jgi:hypothetical protein